MDREALAWAAGLFEGDGWFTSSQRGMWTGVVSIDVDRMEAFQGAVGFGRVNRRNPRTDQKPTWKPIYNWSASSFEHIQALICMLWPWLGPRRRAKAMEMLQIGRRRAIANKDKRHCPQGHTYDAVNTTRDKYGKRYCRACARTQKAKARAQAHGGVPVLPGSPST